MISAISRKLQNYKITSVCKPFSNRPVERKVCKEVYWSDALKRGFIRWREGLFEEGDFTEETYRGN